MTLMAVFFIENAVTVESHLSIGSDSYPDFYRNEPVDYDCTWDITFGASKVQGFALVKRYTVESKNETDYLFKCVRAIVPGEAATWSLGTSADWVPANPLKAEDCEGIANILADPNQVSLSLKARIDKLEQVGQFHCLLWDSDKLYLSPVQAIGEPKGKTFHFC